MNRPLTGLLPMLSALLLHTHAGTAQTTVNPDLSVIPRFLLTTDDGGHLSEGTRSFSRPELAFEELEVVLAGYQNPYARADVVLSIPGPDLEHATLALEEVYGTILRGLPLDVNLRFGKYRAEFGKLNVVHPHAWPFVTQPLVQERFLGEDGLNDLGLSLSALLPTGDVYTRLTVDLLRGLWIPAAAGMKDTSGAPTYYGLSSRLMAFFTLGDESDIETGFSTTTGIHDPVARERFWYFNLDAKYKYAPSSYTSLTLQGECLLNTRRAVRDAEGTMFVDPQGMEETRTITTWGLYLYADLRFLKVFSIGARYDHAESPYSSDDRARAAALFLGYYPVEETLGLRLHYQNTTTQSPGVLTSVNFIGLQALMSLGPHKAHTF